MRLTIKTSILLLMRTNQILRICFSRRSVTMPRVPQLIEPSLFDLVILTGGECPTWVSKLLVLDKIQHILDTAMVVEIWKYC
jgi:hypothetical protein